jgi:hypothetical protein
LSARLSSMKISSGQSRDNDTSCPTRNNLFGSSNLTTVEEDFRLTEVRLPQRQAQMIEIGKEDYEATKKTRKPPPGLQLCDPVQHSEKGMLYFLATKGFHVRLLQLDATAKQPKWDFTFAIPNGDTTVNKTVYTRSLLTSALGSKIKKALTRKKFQSSNDAVGKFTRFIVAGLVAFLPFVSSLSLEVVYPFALHTFFHNNGISIDIESLWKISPKRSSYEKYVREFATHQQLLTAYSMQLFCLSWDKGDKSKVGDYGGTAKLGSWVKETLVSKNFPDGRFLRQFLTLTTQEH